MVWIAALLPTNTPAPMIPPMEIITRWRESRDLESFAVAGTAVDASVAFKGFALVDGAIGRTIRRAVDFGDSRSTNPYRSKTRRRGTTMKSSSQKTLRIFAALAALTMAAFSAQAQAQTSAPKSGHAKANGVKYYYEISGNGEPLLLLHGGLGSIDMFKPILPKLTAHRQVIAIDLHGHGRTELGARKISLPDIGDDMAAILKELGFQTVDVLGYSFGGGVAFRLAVQHPAMVRRLALVSAGFSDAGFYPEIRAQQNQINADFAEQMKQTPMYTSYVAVAPKPEDFPRLLQAMGDLMRGHYDYSADVKKLTMPTMLIFGDSDMYRPEHIVEFYKLLGGGLRDAGWNRETMSKNRLAIIPDQTHYDIFFSPKLIDTALPFLDGVSGSKSWAETAQP
jgi:pimeloyl-ACP methyl ester carboxylesterase